MRPRLIDVENAHLVDDLRRHERASMRPRLIDVENPRMHVVAETPFSVLQCGHV